MNEIPTLRKFYDDLEWKADGAYWAARWGGTEMQWYSTIMPRIFSFLPAGNVIELGAGYGRLSEYLATYSQTLTLMDFCKQCIDACQLKFENVKSIKVVQNDGKNLNGVKSNSVDFIFSFYSLVHSGEETMAAYLLDISDKLSADGVAFIHHSNAKAYAHLEPSIHDYRDTTVSAEIMEKLATKAGLICRSQEIFGWDTDDIHTDCFSVLTKPHSKWAMPNKKFINRTFCSEATEAKQKAKLYGKHAHLY